MQTKKKPARARDKQHKENIILALILSLCLIIVIFISGLQYRTPDTTTSYIVKPGDTLWEIAEMYCPNHHTGNTVFKIEQLNHIDGYIVPGQVLEVPVEPSRGGGREMVMEATAYTHTGNLTKTETVPVEGRTVAVDDSIIPLGSKLIINGQGGYIAEDTGGDIKGQRVDIFLDSRSACMSFGRQDVEVVVVE